MKKFGGGSKGFLEPIRSSVKRKKFAVFDIESKAGKSYAMPGFTRPFLVGLFDPNQMRAPGAGYQEFRDEPHLRARPCRCTRAQLDSKRGCICWSRWHVDPGGCIDKLLSVALSRQYNGYNFYAHNGGNFDSLFLLTWLREHRDEFSFEVIPIQSTIQVIRVSRIPEDAEKKPDEHWEFLDSMRLLPFGLDKACKAFGLPGKVSADLGMQEDDPRWTTYLKQDCIALATVMMKVYDMVESLGGEVGITAPSTAMKLFRRRFLGHDGTPEKIPRWQHWTECADHEHCSGCAHTWIRRGYYGGRTEIHRFQGERLYYFDLNSSYAASMREDMPIGARYVEKGKLDWRRHHSRGGYYSGFCECLIYIPESCTIPPLPHRDVETGKLVFPTGWFRGVWSIEELALLEEPLVGGRIVSVVKTVWFQLKPMFARMVDELWKLRDKNLEGYDEGLSQLAKLLINSSYGKFCMRQERSTIVFTKETKKNPAGQAVSCFLCGEEISRPDSGMCADCAGSKPAETDPESEVWYQAKVTDASYIIPHVGAHITALARVRLWKAMKLVIEKEGQIYYCDSVTGDRTTVVRDPAGNVEVLTFENLWERSVRVSSSGPKQRSKLEGYDVLSERGWSPIREMIRHRTWKQTHRISTKDGQTQVTVDHGIMVDGHETTPMEFVKNKCSFTRVAVPPPAPKKVFDLFQYVRSFSYERELRNPAHTQRYAFEADDEWIFINTQWLEVRGEAPLRVRRYYERDSKEFAALLRLVGAYVCDGSASIPGETTTTRFMLSFCKSNLPLMEQLKADLLTIAPDMTITGPLWTETVYVVRSGTIPMTLLFTALCGHGHLGKRLPSFCFHLSETDFGVLFKALEDGDGYIDVANAFIFTSTSQLLTAGVSLLLGQRKIEHGFSFRESKGAWSIRTRPDGSARKGRIIKDEPFEPQQAEWVYDLSVEGSHTFVDGIGQVLLHNTDSVITDVVLPTSNRLGDLKNEYPDEELNFLAVQPKVYMIEPVKRNAEAKKRHDLLLLALKGDESVDASTLDSDPHKRNFKVTMKGFPQKQRTKANLERLQAGEQLEWEQLEKVRSLAREGFRRPPQMKDVKKSFQGEYDKRTRTPDGGTRALWLDERTFDEKNEVEAAE